MSRFNAISEIKIMSTTGTNIFSGKIDLDKAEIKMADTDVLFAGFISAILSVSEELQNSNIEEIGYQDDKIIFTLTDNLIFMGIASQKVPNRDVNSLLKVVISKWMETYEDQEYPYVSDEMRAHIAEMVSESIKQVFWWSDPDFNLKNNVNLIKSVYRSPGSSYFVQFLPKMYLLTALLIFLVPVLGALVLGTAFSGFASGPPDDGSGDPFTASIFTLGAFWLITPLIMKIIYRSKFELIPLILISGLYSLFLFLLIFFTSNFYISIFDNISNLVGGNLVLTYLVQMFLYFAPFNFGFFGYIIITAYASSYTSNINSARYILTYLLSILIVISITEFVVRGILDVNPSS